MKDKSTDPRLEKMRGFTAPVQRKSLVDRFGLKPKGSPSARLATKREQKRAQTIEELLKALIARKRAEPYAKLRAMPRRDLRSVRKTQRLARQRTQAVARAKR